MHEASSTTDRDNFTNLLGFCAAGTKAEPHSSTDTCRGSVDIGTGGIAGAFESL